jgi:hypothetical protein
MDEQKRSEMAFEQAQTLAKAYGTDLFTRIILEERGDLTDEMRELKELSAKDIENLIRRQVRVGLALQEMENNDKD